MLINPLIHSVIITLQMTGDDSGKVTIWNMAPVQNEEDEMNESVPKLLCQMDNHLGRLFLLITYPQHLMFACALNCSYIKTGACNVSTVQGIGYPS